MAPEADARSAADRPPAPRRRRLAVALVPLLVVAVVVAIVLGTRSPSSPASANPGVATGAATVLRRNLTETDTESGTLSYANSYTVYNRLSGTITWLPAVGQLIKPGQALFDVDGKPVVLMDGSTPAFRALKSSDGPGPDVLELNRNLVRLGYDPDEITVDGTWQAATTTGVEVLQASLGESQTGSLALGKVVFLPGQQLVSTVTATLGNMVSDPAPASGPEFVSLTSSTQSTPSRSSKSSKPCTPKSKKKQNQKHGSCGRSGTGTTLAALTALLEAETAELNAERGSSGSAAKSGSGNSGSSDTSGSSGSSGSKAGSGSSAGGGGGGGSATPVLQTSSTRLVVTVDLDATKQSEAKVGEQVQVELPNGGTVSGKISAVSPVAQSSSGNGGNGGGGGGGAGSGGGGNGGGSGSSGAVIPVTITLSSHQTGAGLDQAAVSVTFAEAEASQVLSVPVTALLATQGGGYAVQEAALPHALLPVTTGLFAAGYVQISGAGIYPGLEVTDSQG